eukprot:SAG11_NODE_2966_length_2806_cov_2.326334_4_plen_95_part_00
MFGLLFTYMFAIVGVASFGENGAARHGSAMYSATICPIVRQLSKMIQLCEPDIALIIFAKKILSKCRVALDPFYFGDLARALLTLFRTLSMDSW